LTCYSNWPGVFECEQVDEYTVKWNIIGNPTNYSNITGQFDVERPGGLVYVTAHWDSPAWVSIDGWPTNPKGHFGIVGLPSVYINDGRSGTPCGPNLSQLCGNYPTGTWDFTQNAATNSFRRATVGFQQYTTPEAFVVWNPQNAYITVSSQCDCPNNCSAPQALSDTQLLYRVRDEILHQTSVGKHYIDLYYGYGIEITGILINNSALRDEAIDTLQSWEPKLRALVDGEGDTVFISQEELNAVDHFLSGLEIAGSNDLRTAIQSEKANLNMQGLVGLTMNEAWEEINDLATTTPTGTPATLAVTETLTVTPTVPPTATETIIPTETGTPTNTSTDTPATLAATETLTPAPTSTPTVTETPSETPFATDTSLPSETATVTETLTSQPSSTLTETLELTATPSETPSETSIPLDTFTATFAPTSTPTNTPTLTPTPTMTSTLTPTATRTATVTPSRTPTRTKTPTNTATPAPIFADVTGGPYRPYIEAIYLHGITSGCAVNPLRYCPADGVTRAQIAVMLLRAKYSASYAPPWPSSQRFTDVPSTHWAYAWIDKFAADGFTSGCGIGVYCPESVTTREQVTVFLLRARNGSSWGPPSYNPPYAYSDISGSPFKNWIQHLAANNVIDYCATGQFCPGGNLTRERIAYFIARLWGW
jgi:hypothetical protein